MTVGCPSNGRRASSISALPAPAAQTSAGGTACSLLPAAGSAAAQASPPHRTPIASLAIPLLTHTCCYSPATADEPVNPRTVHVRWKSFLNHVDHAAPRAPGWWTTARPRKGTTRRQGRVGSCFPRGGEYDYTRVYWFVYRRRRITAGVGE